MRRHQSLEENKVALSQVVYALAVHREVLVLTTPGLGHNGWPMDQQVPGKARFFYDVQHMTNARVAELEPSRRSSSTEEPRRRLGRLLVASV